MMPRARDTCPAQYIKRATLCHNNSSYTLQQGAAKLDQVYADIPDRSDARTRAQKISHML